MKGYSVKKLALMAGVSVRTLHHYDQIGLLKPCSRTTAGYRMYGLKELLRLQQILFYRELGFDLSRIRKILDQKGFSNLKALETHRNLLEKRINRLESLHLTVSRTIESLKGGNMLNDHELYEGFSQEQIQKYEKEARDMFGNESVDRVNNKIRKLSPKQWNSVKLEGEQVAKELSRLTEMDPADQEVQDLVHRHHAWIEHFYPAPADVYRGLADLYVNHEGFKAYYDKYAKGLAQFLSKAMHIYCEVNL